VPFLAQGSGPYVPGTLGIAPPNETVIIGQLDPWPGAKPPATTVCAPPSSGTAVISAPTSTSTATGVRDIITITSVVDTGKKVRGVFTVQVTAVTSDQTANLFLSVVGPTTSNPAPMNNLGNGIWQLAISSKAAPATVIVTSDLGGSASGPA
jgi:hypothetical protein